MIKNEYLLSMIYSSGHDPKMASKCVHKLWRIFIFCCKKVHGQNVEKRVRLCFCTLKSEEHALAAFKTQTHIHSFFFVHFLTHTHIITHIHSLSQTNPLIISVHKHARTHTHTFNLIPDPQRTPWPWRGRPFVLSSLWHQDPCLLGRDPASTSQSAFDNPQVLLQALLADGPHLIENYRENVNTCTEWSLNTFLFFLKIPKIPFCSLKTTLVLPLDVQCKIWDLKYWNGDTLNTKHSS